MKRAPERIVSRRRPILAAAACLAAVCLVLSLRVGVNYDMTKYLPDSSPMKRGMDIMESAFPSLGADKTIRVMAEGLDREREEALLEALKGIPYVDGVAHDGSGKYRRGAYTLYVVATEHEYGSPQERAIESALAAGPGGFSVVYRNDNPGADGVPPWLFIAAIAILAAVLLAMCRSWAEPVLFLADIGVAVAVNSGANILHGDISYVTSTMASVLQLVLSIDYSVMLANRFRQEKAAGLPACEAMAAALRNCFATITGSALTTAAGLLALAFMRFRIGLDLGLVLARGVLISLVCALTVLPALLVTGDRLIGRTAKRTVRLPMGAPARFCWRGRWALTAAAAGMFAAFFFLQKGTDVAFTLAKVDPIADIFPAENPLVIVYANGEGEENGERMAVLGDELARREGVTQVVSWPALFGRAYTAGELAGVLEGLAGMGMGEGLSFDPAMLEMAYAFRFAGTPVPAAEQRMTVPELFGFAQEELMDSALFSAFVTPAMRDTVAGAREQLDGGMRMLRSDRWSRMIVYTSLPVESEETDALLDAVEAAGADLSGEWYMIGNSAMSREMRDTFPGELRGITLLAAAAIFLIVLVSSRSAAVPALLVMIVQLGVYVTVTLVGWQGYSIYFLALLIVECILMGATIDYGILFTGYYREHRRRMGAPDALKAAYEGSVPSVMTSGLILVLVTGILGFTYSDPAVAEICRTISTGALSAIAMILLLLPGLLAALDRLVVRRRG